MTSEFTAGRDIVSMSGHGSALVKDVDNHPLTALLQVCCELMTAFLLNYPVMLMPSGQGQITPDQEKKGKNKRKPLGTKLLLQTSFEHT